jgi:hypothetical protein
MGYPAPGQKPAQNMHGVELAQHEIEMVIYV